MKQVAHEDLERNETTILGVQPKKHLHNPGKRFCLLGR